MAEDRYHQRINEVAARLYRLPSAQPAIGFGKYADTYAVDVIAHHRGARRELELLKVLRTFSDDLLTVIDPDRVRAYTGARRQTKPRLVLARTVNREVDLLKAMLRDAVPKYLPSSPILPRKRRLLTTDEEAKLLVVGDKVDRALLILRLDSLIRLGDLLDLERSDWQGPWLYVRDPKGGTPYAAALSPRAVDALEALPIADRYLFEKFRRAEKERDWTGPVRQRPSICARRRDSHTAGASAG